MYFLFIDNDSKIDFTNERITIFSKLKITLNKQRVSRLFFNNNDIFNLKNSNKIYNLFIVQCKVDSEKKVSFVENGIFYNDCNEVIHNIIEKNESIYGFSSISHNKIISALLFGTDSTEKINTITNISLLYGENGWNSLEEYFDILYISGIKYVTLRKNEEFPFSFIENDKDLDILCKNKNEFKYLSNAILRDIGISSYKIKIKDSWIALDIRFIGDNYFDSAWENDILNKIIYNRKKVSIMDKTNQLFTILYHVLTQKKNISNYYVNKIIEYYPYKNIDEIIFYLVSFMNSNNYKFIKPIDLSVYQNKKNIKKIKSLTDVLNKRELIFNNFISKLPNKFFLKKVIKKYIISCK